MDKRDRLGYNAWLSRPSSHGAAMWSGQIEEEREKWRVIAEGVKRVVLDDLSVALCLRLPYSEPAARAVMTDVLGLSLPTEEEWDRFYLNGGTRGEEEAACYACGATADTCTCTMFAVD